MIQEQIRADLKTAMKENNIVAKNLLRVVIGEFNREGKEVTDERAVTIIKKMVENLKLLQANLVDNQNEIDVLEKYLPKQMDELELNRVLMNYIMNLDETPSMKHMGTTMNYLKDKFAGQYDGKVASDIIRKLLN